VFDRTLAAIACGLLLAGTGLFLIDGFRDRISADAAVTLRLAQHVLETGAPMPADWYYGNGDFWILGPQLFSLPFVAAWGAVPRALAFGNATGLAFLFASVVALGRAAGARWTTALIAASLAGALYSHFQREFVVVQLSYGLMAAKLMLALACALVWLRAPPNNRRARVALAAYVVLLAIWTAENPMRPLAYLVLPLAIALRAKAKERGATVLAAATLLAVGAGWIVRQALLAHLQMVPGLDAFHLTRTGDWSQHVRWLGAGLKHLYGGDALGDPPFPLVDALLAVLRAASLPLIGVLVIGSSLRRVADAQAEPATRIPFAVGVLGFALVAAILVVGSVMVDPVSDRYLIPTWMLTLSGAVLAARSLASWRWIALLLVVAFPLGGLLNAIGIARAGSATDAAGLPRPPSLDGVVAALRDAGFSRGFASHRHAGVVGVRSGAQIEMCDVLWQPQPVPARWQTAETYFDPARYANGFFMLLAPDERDAAHERALTAAIGIPGDVREADGYAIWLYPRGSGKLDWLAR
jgi:hypothetical protein